MTKLNEVVELKTKRFVIRKSLIGKNTVITFVNKKQVEEYKSIHGTGWYAKMYQIMVSTAGNALNKGYPITSKEVAHICRTLDNETGNWYLKRDMEKEADRAIEFVFRNQGL